MQTHLYHDTEADARAAGEIVYRSSSGVAWCLCDGCTVQHQNSPRRTRHDRWALNNQDYRILADIS